MNSMENAFIGFSLDSKLFTRAWLRQFVPYILDRHNSLLINIADDLFLYTRCSQNMSQINFQDGELRTKKLLEERRAFIKSELERLGKDYCQRINLCGWSAFADSSYSGLLRKFRIAFETLPYFRSCIIEAAQAHKVEQMPTEMATNLNVAYLLDEIAMCIRITEIGDFPCEYHPSNTLPVLEMLYSGRFADDGLSVTTLTDKSTVKRSFTVLRCGEQLQS